MSPKDNDKILLLEKGKRGLLQVILGRTTVILVLMVLQIGLLFWFFEYLSQYIPIASVAYAILSISIVLYIINQPENPSIQLSWVAMILLLPVFGSLLYLFLNTQIGHRLINQKLQMEINDTRNFSRQEDRVIKKLREKNAGIANLSKYMNQYGPYPTYDNSAVEYFPIGEDMFEAMIEQLQKAEKFIFLEFFIIKEGYMWGRVLKILQEKAEQGVEVRLLYDGTCAIALLPYRYPKEVQKLGIQCKMFAPIRPTISTHYNNRDHRKILVIDGKTAFTGGVNLADEYINQRKVYGHWKDTGVMIQGDAVKSFTLMFLQMWNITEYKQDYGKYLNLPKQQIPEAKGFVMPYGDSPLDGENVAEMVYMDIINRAERYVHITTPYLILDHEMVTALTFAAKRGVEVIILMPHIPDKKYAFALAKTHYPELIRAGVHIYEYTPGFVHAKMFVADDREAVVGTVNLDYRSLYLHFECGAYFYDNPAVGSVEKDIQETLQKSQLITIEDCRHEKLTVKLGGKLLRLFAPLM